MHHHQPSSRATMTSRAWRVQFHQGLHQVQAVGLQKHQMTHLSVWGLHDQLVGLHQHLLGFFNIFSKVVASMTSSPCWHQWQFHQQSPPLSLMTTTHAPFVFISPPLASMAKGAHKKITHECCLTSCRRVCSPFHVCFFICWNIYSPCQICCYDRSYF